MSLTWENSAPKNDPANWGPQSCEAVTHVRGPEREADVCGREPYGICNGKSCEAILCIVHSEECPICKQIFCANCVEDHACSVSTDLAYS